jgi:hypothetical protein
MLQLPLPMAESIPRLAGLSELACFVTCNQVPDELFSVISQIAPKLFEPVAVETTRPDVYSLGWLPG